MEEKKKFFIILKDLSWIIFKKYKKKKIFFGENKKENRLFIRYKVKILLN